MLIAVLNQSSKVTKAEHHVMTRAVGYQLRHHVAPAWNLQSPHVLAFDSLGAVPEGADILTLLDNADEANALGYHDLTPDGRPYGRIFVIPSLDNGDAVSSVLSHEAAELLGDPLINNWSNDDRDVLHANELCDAVEGDSYKITVYGETSIVSNFLLPAWFSAVAAPGTEFDFLANLKQPFTMTDGGYEIQMVGGHVAVMYGASHPAWRKAEKLHPASRTARRLAAVWGKGPTQPPPTIEARA